MDAVRSVTGFAVFLQLEPHSQMPVVTQFYANYAMGPLLLNAFLLELSFPVIFYVGVWLYFWFPL